MFQYQHDPKRLEDVELLRVLIVQRCVLQIEVLRSARQAVAASEDLNEVKRLADSLMGG